eukprot:TRINITY_DN8122_c0_g1_i2.p1 TRINITY_DN8122_c0_g1~~TRINITY_DN8122_c0_g1_i2.p1  ORF type:complete len:208 (+),score=30.40 TRINITY_DN8122_c0_g1_i2:38-661(+)
MFSNWCRTCKKTFSSWERKSSHVSRMSRPKVGITTRIPESGLKKIVQSCNIVLHWENDDQPLPRGDLLRAAQDIDGILCVLSDKVDSEFLSFAPSLRVVSTMSVGYDHVDMIGCNRRGIKVGNTPGVLTETTADLVLALLLATARRIPEAYAAVKQGSWPNTWKPQWMCGRDLHHSTVGIIGMGRIAQAVVNRLVGFHCKILFTGLW